VKARRDIVALLVVVAAAGCGGDDGYDWELPPGFPDPRVPEDNAMSDEKAELGRYLFYDTRLSGNQTQSCASCHLQSLAFTDGLGRSPGSTGDMTPRSSMSLANVGYSPTLTWANPALRDDPEKYDLARMFLLNLYGAIYAENKGTEGADNNGEDRGALFRQPLEW